MRQEHNIKPVYSKDSKVLILGSFPSVISRKNNFFYAHPQNRFWKVMSIVFNEDINDRKEFLLKHNIAMWDVIASCDIEGSSDSSIKNVVPNNIKEIIDKSSVKYIFTLGKKSYDLYNKYVLKDTNMEAKLLSSTSPANANKSLNDLVNEFKIIVECLKK